MSFNLSKTNHIYSFAFFVRARGENRVCMEALFLSMISNFSGRAHYCCNVHALHTAAAARSLIASSFFPFCSGALILRELMFFFSVVAGSINAFNSIVSWVDGGPALLYLFVFIVPDPSFPKRGHV